MCDLSSLNATADCELKVSHRQDSLPATVIQGMLYSLLFIMGSFGNLMVLGATVRFSELRKPSCILICNVCVCDIVLLAVGLGDFVANSVALESGHVVLKCQVLRPLSDATILIMVTSLVSIAFERFLAIMYPLRKSLHLTLRKVFIVAALSDSVSLLLTLPGFLATRYDKATTRCTETWGPKIEILYHSLMFLIEYLVPLPTMMLLYAFSWNCLRKRNKRTIELNTKCRSPTLKSPDRQSNLYSSLTNISDESKHFLKSSSPVLRKSASAVSLRCSKRSNALTCDEQNRRSWQRLSNNRLSRSFSMALRGDADTALSAFAKKRYQQSVETLRVFTSVVFIFAISMLPRHIQQLMDIRNAPMNPVLYDVLSCFIYINAATNPFIYGGMSKDYRMAYKRIFNKNRQSGIINLIKASVLSPATNVALKEMTDAELLVVKRNLLTTVHKAAPLKPTGKTPHTSEALLKLLSTTLRVPMIIISGPEDEGDLPYCESERQNEICS